MSRRFEEVESRLRSDLDGAKMTVKRLGDPERAHVLAWLCRYFGDDGVRLGSNDLRRRITLDGIEFWLVRVPKSR